ncbi:MAG: hypothetical protein ACI9OJ_000120 [Myxococcota bacterium]
MSFRRCVTYVALSACAVMGCSGDETTANPSDVTDAPTWEPADYETVAVAFCLDLVSSAVSLLPDTNLSDDPARDFVALYLAAKPLCDLLMTGRSAEVMALYARNPALADTFAGGFAGFEANTINPTDFGRLSQDYLGEVSEIGAEGLHQLLYGDRPSDCVETASGATGTVYSTGAILEGLLTLRDGVFYGPEAPLPNSRLNGCVGSSVGRFFCAAEGLDLALESCANGCKNGQCCEEACHPDPSVAPPSPDGLNVQFPACELGDAACPAAGAIFDGLELPDCQGQATNLTTAACGSAVTVFYYHSAWCPVCLQQTPELLAFAPGLAERGVRLVFVVGRDAGFNPPTSLSCGRVEDELGSDSIDVLYDPKGEFLQRLDAGMGGGAFAVLDGAGNATRIVKAGGALSDLNAAITSTLEAACE